LVNSLSRSVVRVFPFLVPVAYLAAVFWLQPDQRLGDPQAAPWLGRLLYDDYDSTAFALRGLNANLGRSAGRVAMPPRLDESDFKEALDDKQTLEPRYFLEYPQTALLIFRLGWVSAASTMPAVPPAICDADYHNLVEHVPRNESERALWHAFRKTIRTYDLMMLLCLLGLMAVLRAGYEPGGRLTGPLAWSSCRARFFSHSIASMSCRHCWWR